jgi:hypothetical protein
MRVYSHLDARFYLEYYRDVSQMHPSVQGYLYFSPRASQFVAGYQTKSTEIQCFDHYQIMCYQLAE